MRWIIFVCLSLPCKSLFCQNVAINATGTAGNSSAILDLSGGITNGSKGFLPENVSLSGTDNSGPITNPAVGLVVYNIVSAGLPPTNVVPGYYYWDGTDWIYLINNSKTNSPIPCLLLNSCTAGRYYNPGFNVTKTSLDYWAGGLFPGKIDYYAAYESDNNYVVTSTGNFSKVYGWLNSSVATKTVTVYAYAYTPVDNSSVDLVGALLGSQTVNIGTSKANYYFEVTGNTALTKGQFIKVYFVPNANMELYSIGMIECTYIPQ